MPIEVKVPDLGESITEATIARWMKQEGDMVESGEALVELETDKANLEVSAERSGTLSSVYKKEGDDVRVGDVLAVIEETAREAPKKKLEEPPPPPPEPEEQPQKQPPEKEAPEPDWAEEQAPRPEPPPGKVPEMPSVDKEKPDIERKPEGQARMADAERFEERVRMSRRRRTIATRLVEAQRAAAMLTTFNEVDMTAVMELRRRHKESFEKRYGVGLGLTSFFVKASIAALKEFPRLNAEVDGDEMIIKHYYDVGIAIGDPEGLVVPVLRHADRMSFADIEKAVKRFVEQAQNGTFSIEDLRGGTFTITNGGVFGSLMSTPILNPPQVGILGLHRIQDRPVVIDGQVTVRPMMYVALSYDHRIVDGRESVQFLVRVKQLLEDPERLLLEG
ncbi:MAG TPA: 2-oxoglutarate dehydrogenase complex dihydrolipoyllysine-residue succinyltransferase [Acidobacteriota bacterium]|nr:2-oxoglutarate dehydrogenase complex dihydrolipoyllysine-residue succinyltransferase [Acidobacteriota bacterium]